jgi:NAD-dependent deacetylase
MNERSTFSDTLVSRLVAAESVAVLTGAGISAESGISTFRDPGGLWQKYRPEELASFDAFLGNPTLVQGWYAHRRAIAREKHPNPGHAALVALEEIIDDFTLITQNVDNLHRRAGSGRILELHGNITRSYCVTCRRPSSEEEMRAFAEGSAAHCGCGGLIRPDVVWFGEMLPEDAIMGAIEAAARADVFLSIGTSGIVYPAADLPLQAAHAGAYVAEINIEPSALAGAMDEVILGPAGTTLPRLVAAVKQRRKEVSS